MSATVRVFGHEETPVVWRTEPEEIQYQNELAHDLSLMPSPFWRFQPTLIADKCETTGEITNIRECGSIGIPR